MSAKKTGLGRGFDSLIPTESLEDSFDPTSMQDERVSDLRYINTDKILPDDDQPRRHFDQDGIDQLASSIKQHGILQPIVVIPYGGGYQIVAGERRYRASKQIGLEKIPVIVRTLSGQHKLELSLIENLQRRDLNVLETATAYAKLRNQFNLTLDEIGERVGGKSASSISNTMRLLKLPENVKQAVANNQLSEGQARPLVGVDEAIINQVLAKAIKESWSARQIEKFIADNKQSVRKPSQPSQAAKQPEVYSQDSKQFTKRFQTSVQVKAKSSGSGQIVIPFKSDDDYARIKKLLDK
ncbi:MAG: ParB/RepB/Spo0J family partition protein [bacterium]|nr:ParB/RepB/Spo0J family partition protein [bacterium]MDN5835368.1 ParB/RepB/Spo0J family partition protein [bacterium]